MPEPPAAAERALTGDAAERARSAPIRVATAGHRREAAARLAPALFSLALFVNAALLFTLEPMFTKMVLPLLGGTSSVWTTALLFFQAALLGGYLYAHVSASRLRPRAQVALHLLLAALATVALPVALPRGWQPPGAGSPVPWLLGVLALSLGAPFVVLAAGAPLLQRWFARTGHPSADNPYFLYAASNAGSLAALLAYPVLLEPHLRFGAQSRLWAGGYATLVLLVAGCAMLARAPAGRPAPPPPSAPGAVDAGRATARERAWWTLLSFVPSSLLLGTTAYLSTDVAAVPLLWVVPLALYLLSFVLVFARRPPLPRELVLRVQALVVAPLAVLLLVGATRPLWLLAGYNLLALFTTALVLHGELAARRPAAERLTEFYLWVSVGGVLGGVFNVLVAPHVFDSVVEYPLMIVLGCALRPAAPADAGERRATRRWRRALDVALPLALFAAVVLPLTVGAIALSPTQKRAAAAWGLAGVICFLFRGRPLRFALGVAALIVAGAVARRAADGAPLFRQRSFFGVYTVRADGDYHLLTNGTTLHGGQLTLAGFRREPLTYYHREGPVGQLFATLPPLARGRRVAAVGLGAGTLACYARPGDAWTFYEIDPLAERIARDPRLFTYLRDCAPGASVVLGDARRSLARAPARGFDLVLLDAFTSDAIPVHLLTREALALYLAKLDAGGLIAVHVSNRHLDLVPVVAGLARDARVAGAVGSDAQYTEEQKRRLKNNSTWVVLGRHATDFAALVRQPGWRPLPPTSSVRLWTDDASDLLSVFKWR